MVVLDHHRVFFQGCLLLNTLKYMSSPLGLVGKTKEGSSRLTWTASVGSIPSIPPTQNTCFVDHFNILE
jgi:hypothetical protein